MLICKLKFNVYQMLFLASQKSRRVDMIPHFTPPVKKIPSAKFPVPYLLALSFFIVLLKMKTSIDAIFSVQSG